MYCSNRIICKSTDNSFLHYTISCCIPYRNYLSLTQDLTSKTNHKINTHLWWSARSKINYLILNLMFLNLYIDINFQSSIIEFLFRLNIYNSYSNLCLCESGVLTYLFWLYRWSLHYFPDDLNFHTSSLFNCNSPSSIPRLARYTLCPFFELCLEAYFFNKSQFFFIYNLVPHYFF